MTAVRLTGVVLLACLLLGLEWAWRHNNWQNLVSHHGQCVMVGASVNNGRVPEVDCSVRGARRVVDVVDPGRSCPEGATRVSVRHELSHDTGYIGALCLSRP